METTTWEIIKEVLMWIIGIGGIGGIIMLYKARPEKKGIEIDNDAKETDITSKIIEQVNNAIDTVNEANALQIKSIKDVHRREMEGSEKRHKEDLAKIDTKLNTITLILRKASNCKYPPIGQHCPIIFELDSVCPHIASEVESK